MRFTRATTGAVTAVVVTLSLLTAPSPAYAEGDDTVTTGEVSSAINSAEKADPGFVSEPVVSGTDSDSAAKTEVEGASVDVPKDPQEGVTFTAEDGSTVTVGLPNADEAAPAKRLADGTVVYPADDGSANAVVPGLSGVQMLVHIANRDAPTSYDYDGAVPEGGSIELRRGGAVILDAAGELVLTVPRPEARDARQRIVPSSYKTDGTKLTLVVKHTKRGYAYPVLADPFWIVPAAVVAAFQAGVIACGLGGLRGAAWQIFWNGWVWQEVRRAGAQGCVQGIIGRFLPWIWAKQLIKGA